MSSSDIESLVAALNSRLTDPARNQVIGDSGGEQPRFELYHFFMSMCSYKLRTILTEKEVTWTSHDVDIFPPEPQNYYPEYVRLRLLGRDSNALDYVSGYTGRSATETEGFDPCVVPTMVDHDAGLVLANSKRVALYLDSVIDSGTDLIPDDIREDVIRQVDICDRTPHVAVLYGAHPDHDPRPGFLQEQMPHVHDAKMAAVKKNMAEVADEPELVAAYEAKIAKEAAAKQFVRTESDMRASIQEFRDILGQLSSDLKASGGEWLFGDRYTMADLFWACSLYRIRWLGMGYIFESEDSPQYSPELSAYNKRLMDRPSFRFAVLDWPMHPPSDHTPELMQGAA